MQLEFAFLADAAHATADGKFYVLGGGISALYAPSFPILHSSLAVVIKLHISKAEAGLEHHLRIELLNPLNATAMPPLGGKFTPQPNKDHPDWPITAELAITIANLLLEMPGKYLFRLSVDNVQLGTLPLYTSLPSPAGSLPTRINPSTEEEV